MPTAIIGIGLPASGKTTRLKQIATELRAPYVCPDDIRADLSGNAKDHSRNTEAWSIAYRKIESALMYGDYVVIDATNAKAQDRQQMARFCRNLGARTVGYWFKTPLRVCMERNQARERVVPDRAMRRMAYCLRSAPPDLTDGFDEIIKILPPQGS